MTITSYVGRAGCETSTSCGAQTADDVRPENQGFGSSLACLGRKRIVAYKQVDLRALGVGPLKPT